MSVSVSESRAMDMQAASPSTNKRNNSPYKVAVCIHEAENLMSLPDTGTCDPYIIAMIDDKIVGQSSTVSRNHSNPSWEEYFETPLLHCNSKLYLNVLHNRSSEGMSRDYDYILGVIAIDLSTVTLNSTRRYKYPLEKTLASNISNTSKSKGALTFSMRISKNDNIIRVVSMLDFNDMIKQFEEFNRTKFGLSIESILNAIDATDAVRHAVRQSSLVTDYTLFNYNFIKDVLYDSYAITSMRNLNKGATVRPAATDKDQDIDKTQLIHRPLVTSTYINLEKNTYQYCFYGPIAESCIQLVLQNQSPILNFPNKHILWTWVRWIRLAYDFWNNNILYQDLPNWAKAESITHVVRILHGGTTMTGRCTISLNKNYEIWCESIDSKNLLTIDTTTLSGMIISVDSVLPTNYLLHVEVDSARITANYRERTRSTSAGNDDELSHDYVYSNNNGGDNRQSKVFGSGISHSKYSKRDSLSTYVVVKCGALYHKCSSISGMISQSSSIDWKEYVYIGINSTDDISCKYVEFYLYHGVAGLEKLVAQERIPLAQLILLEQQHNFVVTNKRLNGEIDGYIEDLEPRILLADSLVENLQELDVPLNSSFGLQVVLVSGTGLPPKYGAPNGKFYIRCRYVKWNGADRGNEFGKEFKSPEYKACYSPSFDDYSFILHAKEGIDWARFVRLELYYSNTGNITSKEEFVGAVFIPLDHFGDNFVEEMYYLSHDEDISGNVAQRVLENTNNCGSLKVKIRRVTDYVDSNILLHLRSVLVDSDPYTTMYPADCILAGCLEKDGNNVESCSLSPAYDNLMMVFPSNKNVFDNLITDNELQAQASDRNSFSTTTSSNSLDHLPLTNTYTNSPVSKSAQQYKQEDYDELVYDEDSGVRDSLDNCMEIHVYENERKLPHPPFEWSSNALTAADRPHYSDETGQQESYFTPIDMDLPAPEGYEWATMDWVLDDQYTRTDDDGWVYGTDFSTLMSNTRKGLPCNVATGRVAVRRRKWIRFVRAVDEYIEEQDSVTSPSIPNISITIEASTDKHNQQVKKLHDEFEQLAIEVESPIGSPDGSTKTHVNNGDEEDDDDDSDDLMDRNSIGNYLDPTKVDLTKCIAIELYENERRQPYPPFSWSFKNLFSSERHRYSDESGSHKSVFVPISDIRPPSGYKWVGVWAVDKLYTNCDSEGWSYAVDFASLSNNLKRNKSVAASLGRAVRRRKWIRLVLPEELYLTLDSEMDKDTISDMAIAKKRKSKALNRAKEATVNRDAILHLCKERDVNSNFIKIPYSQVLHVDLITESILFLSIQVNRYFGKAKGGGDEFRPAMVEIFVSNCPAAALKSLIDERIALLQIRENVKELVFQGHLGVTPAGNYDTPLETRELSLGSETIAALDSDAHSLDMRINELEALYHPGQGDNPQQLAILAEVRILQQRALRLRLYVATLLGEGLEGYHNFTEEEVLNLMQTDFDAASHINHGDAVLTANNRIEYLLDTAEVRIRDAALCGWAYQGGVLEACIEIFVNGFFIEMIALLAKFFESNSTQTAELQGLESKLKLIATFLKHNDRLDNILQLALRPYGMSVVPQPHLSLYLDFNTLLTWYSRVLHEEMEKCTRSAIDVWRDTTKDASGQASDYQFTLPWYPIRRNRDRGPFQSLLLEDVISYLTNYLKIARFEEDNIAPSFRKSLDVFDAKVALSFARSFHHVCDAYWEVLALRDWTVADAGLTEEQEFEQLDEHILWLSSVANDARRVVESSMLLVFRNNNSSNIDEETNLELASEVDRIHSKFLKISNTAIDEVTCVIFKVLSSHSIKTATSNSTSSILTSRIRNVQWRLFDVDFYSDWEKSALNKVGNTGQQNTVLAELMTNLQSFLQARWDYLLPYCYYKLLQVCADKVMILYFQLIKTAYVERKRFERNGPEIIQITQDIEMIKKCFQTAVQSNNDTMQYSDALSSKLRRLDQSLQLINCDSSTNEFPLLLKSIHKIAQGNPSDAIALANFTQICFSLRADVGNETRGSNDSDSSSSKGFMSMLKRASVSTKFTSDKIKGDGDARTMCDLYVNEMLSLHDEVDDEDVEEGGVRILELVNMSPEGRVFSTSGKYSNLTLEILLIKSAKFTKQEVDETKKRWNFSSFTPVSSTVKGVTDLVSKGGSLSKFMKDNIVSVATSVATKVIDVGSTIMTNDNTSVKPSGANSIQITSIRLRSLFTFDGTIPKCFVAFRLVNINDANPSDGSDMDNIHKTSIKKGTLNPSWNDETIEILIPPACILHETRLLVSLYYQGRLYGMDLVGTIRIALEEIYDGVFSDASGTFLQFDYTNIAKSSKKYDECVQENIEVPKFALKIMF